jgi:thiol-disulfide isomerase/thioredoxin
MMKPINIENYDQNYAAYEPDKELLTRLGILTQDTDITAIIGTWCGDSKLYVPQFYKLLDSIGFTESNLMLIEVDEEKKAINGSIDHLNIISVPTFIVYKQGKELGRIVESPQQTLELDLLTLLEKP